MEVRAARAADIPAMQAIEVRAGQRFREVGLAAVADDPPPSAEQLERHLADGLAWSAVDDDGEVAGYLVATVVDGDLHVEQVSVDPDHQGRGAGRSLLDAAAAEAVRRGLPALTLTTFREVAWNAPLYQHLGFRAVDPDDVGPELARLVAEETEHGLDPDLRVCMRRDL